MSLDAYLKAQGYDLHHSDTKIRLEKKRKINVTSIVVGVIGVGVLSLMGVVFSMNSFYVVAGLIVLVVMRFNFRGTRPITIFDWTHTMMVKKSVWFFINSKSTKITGYNGIDINTIDLGSESSEGVDEFQKTIYLKTSSGNVDVVDFYSEVEPMEPELKEIMQIIHDYLVKKS
ncbi:MAG: hypothetical protein GY816_06420 [Cytophagales bacterium]|nr:hypothetical protein [Cytophagales bacterium]